jgi:hypothetical protein
MGALMIVFAFLMLGQYDLKFQNRIADDLPAFLVNPSESIETGDAAQDALADIRGNDTTPAADRIQAGAQAADDGPETVARKSDLPVIGAAPEFSGTQEWFNTPDGTPLTMASLRGKVVLIDFWTYSCINCIAALPQALAKYHDQGLEIVGVHTPSSRSRRTPATSRMRSFGRTNTRWSGQRLPSGTLREPVLAGRVLRRREGRRPLRHFGRATT